MAPKLWIWNLAYGYRDGSSWREGLKRKGAFTRQRWLTNEDGSKHTNLDLDLAKVASQRWFTDHMSGPRFVGVQIPTYF